MKNSIWHLSIALLVGLGLACTFPKPALGQSENIGPNAKNNSISAPPAHVPWSNGGPMVRPEGWVKPHSEEELRFFGLFAGLKGYEETAKKLDDEGNSGWAEHYRTKLERESGLTATEAEQVKQIALQYFQDLVTNGEKSRAIQERIMAESPHSWRQAIFSDPEYAALHEQKENQMNQAIAKLVSILGSRSFTKLDFYTRHMDDQMKAAHARKLAESSQGGVQK
jgi:hypothetical protein